ADDLALELVRAALRHDVDVAAEELAVAHVERRGLDRELLDRAQRDRAAARRVAALVEAEVVVLADAVDGHAVVPGVRAADRERAGLALDARLRVAADEVA